MKRVPKASGVSQVHESEGHIEVTKTIVEKGETASQKRKSEKIKIRPFVTNTATVSVKFGATIPTVEYGSARVDVMLSCPCYKEEMLDVFNQLREMCDALIDKEAARLTGDEDE